MPLVNSKGTIRTIRAGDRVRVSIEGNMLFVSFSEKGGRVLYQQVDSDLKYGDDKILIDLDSSDAAEVGILRLIAALSPLRCKQVERRDSWTCYELVK